MGLSERLVWERHDDVAGVAALALGTAAARPIYADGRVVGNRALNFMPSQIGASGRVFFAAGEGTDRVLTELAGSQARSPCQCAIPTRPRLASPAAARKLRDHRGVHRDTGLGDIGLDLAVDESP